jgi:hypothetical protein
MNEGHRKYAQLFAENEANVRRRKTKPMTT